MKTIKNKTFPQERALYAEKDLILENCSFDGAEDGESALKEARDITAVNCFFNLRYPLWHDRNVKIANSVMTEKSRAALWYSNGIIIESSSLNGIKALRECGGITMTDTKVVSPEFGWKNDGITASGCDVEGEYPFFMSKNIHFDNVTLRGKYSFQYTENVVVENSVLDTKDAFWHSENVTIRNSVIKGEYLAWYSDGLTLEHCKIIGTQPLCYCKNLTLIDCETENADLSFEYSDVNAAIKGEILSVKNPRSGKIVADRIGEIIITDDSVYECTCDIVERSKNKKTNA